METSKRKPRTAIGTMIDAQNREREAVDQLTRAAADVVARLHQPSPIGPTAELRIFETSGSPSSTLHHGAPSAIWHKDNSGQIAVAIGHGAITLEQELTLFGLLSTFFEVARRR